MLRRLGAVLRRAVQNRDIFEFWDGTHYRRVDPVVVCRALENDKHFDATVHPKLAEDGDDEAIRITVSAVRSAFGVPEFDGQRGMTESECLMLLLDFWNWSGDLKKKLSTLPISPPPTVSEPSVQSTTRLDTDSGSISPEPAGETLGT